MFSIKVKARPIKGRSKEVRLELVFLKPDFLVFRRFLTLLRGKTLGFSIPII